MQIRELSPELAKKAKEELNEVPQRIESDVKAIKEWIAKEPHLRARTDDQWIVGFLRGCKYSLERTKEKIDMFYTLRSVIPEMTLPVDPMEPWVQELLSLGSCVPLQTMSESDEPRVIIIRPGVCDPNKMSIMDSMRVNNMYSLIQMVEDDTSVISGQRYLVDMDKFTFAHFTQMTPSIAKKMVTFGEKALPLRQKGAHHINAPSGSEALLNFFKGFMNEKNRSRIFIHNGDMEGLYKFVPKAILPTEYGGDAGPIQNIIDDWKKKIESYRDWLLDDMLYKSEESKRKGMPKNTETLFGIEGSFRQLNVD